MKLPVVSGSEAVRACRKVGYEFDDQHGSHMIFRHAHPVVKGAPVCGAGEAFTLDREDDCDTKVRRGKGGGGTPPSLSSLATYTSSGVLTRPNLMKSRVFQVNSTSAPDLTAQCAINAS